MSFKETPMVRTTTGGMFAASRSGNSQGSKSVAAPTFRHFSPADLRGMKSALIQGYDNAVDVPVAPTSRVKSAAHQSASKHMEEYAMDLFTRPAPSHSNGFSRSH